MQIGLIGYGKMGKAIEEIALERGHNISTRITGSSSASEWSQLKRVDVAIEFSRPEAALNNFRYCFKNGIPLVTGTTGWYEDYAKVEAWTQEFQASFFWASNFSIGVNLFWQLNERLAELMSRYPDYKVSMREIHHTQKLDEPSGTAITTAQQIMEYFPQLERWKLASESPEERDLPIESIREGDVKGTHIVHYESEIDLIELKHAAKTRKGFALGAVLAAEFLQGKQGLFTMKDLLKQ